ncbi:MAG: DoxX family protein [Micropepsaceae bacterium]
MIDTSTSLYGAALLRITLGLAALAHGLVLKVLTFGVGGTVGYFESIGYPGFFAYLVMFGEIAGGVALLTGVYARTAALLMMPILLGAAAQHAANGWVFNATGGGWEYPVFWTAASLASALIGPGAFVLKVPFLPREPFFAPSAG